MSDTKPNTHIIALDAFRGLAAVCVVAHHIGQISGMSIGRHGYIAVDFFFMLSGFVVSQAYERTFGGGVRAASFLWARVQRLYPTIFVGL
ncbi:MAG: acyltransferase, partial [Hymenobacter sp.]